MSKKLTINKKLTGKTVDEKLDNLAAIVAKGFSETVTKKDLDTKLDELAAMVAEGFAETVTKKEFVEFKDEMYGFKREMTSFAEKTNKSLFDLESRVTQIEINLVKLTEQVEKFIHIVEAQQAEIRELRALVFDLKRRVEKLETNR